MKILFIIFFNFTINEISNNFLDKTMLLSEIVEKITVVENFKGEGVNFFDINTLLADHVAWESCMKWAEKILKGVEFDMFAGIDARGFLFKELASRMGKGFTMIRKAGKLPNCIESDSYSTEYSNGDKLSINNSIPKDTRIIIVDDFSVTYGTCMSAKNLIKKAGYLCVAMFTLAEVVNHPRRINTDGLPIYSLFKYDKSAKTTKLTDNLNNWILTQEFHNEFKVKRYQPLEIVDNNYSTVVMYHPTMQEIAENIVLKNPSARLGTIIWKKFKDGTDDITFENEKYFDEKHIIFIMAPFGDLFSQISIIKVLPRQGINSLHVILPYFKCGTMERVNEYGPNTLATADTLSNILSIGMQNTKTGPIRLTIYDLHTLANRFYFKDIDFRMESCIELLKKKISRDTVIVFPDDGAKKRFGDAFKDHVTISCSKIRDGDKRIITCDFGELPIKVTPKLINGELETIIVDDLVQTGSTLIEVCKVLKKKGVKKVNAYVTHVVFPDDSHMRFIDAPENERFCYFYHTNTNPDISKKICNINAKTNNGNPFLSLDFEDLITITKSPKQNIGYSPFVNKSIKIFMNPYIHRKSFADIYVASSSNIKLEAVYNAFSRRINCRVFGVSGIPSEVPNQPIGKIETETGCSNRLQFLLEYMEDKNLNGIAIAIENGIFHNKDFSSIMLCLRTPEIITFESDMIEFPIEYSNKCLESEGNITVGELLNRDYGYDADSWHHHFGNRTRSELITDAIISNFIF